MKYAIFLRLNKSLISRHFLVLRTGYSRHYLASTIKRRKLEYLEHITRNISKNCLKFVLQGKLRDMVLKDNLQTIQNNHEQNYHIQNDRHEKGFFSGKNGVISSFWLSIDNLNEQEVEVKVHLSLKMPQITENLVCCSFTKVSVALYPSLKQGLKKFPCFII